MAGREKTPENEPRVRIPNKKVTAIFIAAILVVGGGLLVFSKTQTTNCLAVNSASTKLIKDGKYKEAYTKLKAGSNECGIKVAKNATNVRFECTLAVSAYRSNHIAEARIYAQSDLLAMNKLKSQEASKIPQSTNVKNILSDISVGSYYYRLNPAGGC